MKKRVFINEFSSPSFVVVFERRVQLTQWHPREDSEAKWDSLKVKAGRRQRRWLSPIFFSERLLLFVVVLLEEKMFFLVLNSFFPFLPVFAILLWLDFFLSFLNFTSQVSQEYLESVNVLLLHVFHFSCLPHGKSLSKSLNFSCFAFFFSSSSSSSLSSSSWLRFAVCLSLSVFRLCLEFALFVRILDSVVGSF